MARRVYIHLGLPKTATTYLQTILWSARDRMREQGVLLPGRERRDHLWASRIIREDKNNQIDEARRTSWERLRTEIEQWPDDALISHEFFASASTAQAERMVADLAPAEVHLIATAREPLGLFAAGWQESLKNREYTPMEEFAPTISGTAMSIWNWRALDLSLVLQRWKCVAPQRVHVLPLAKNGPRDLIWQRFATLVGLDPDSFDLSQSFSNSSMGVVEAETLRRVNEHLVERDLFWSPYDRGVFIRTFLADERLVPRNGERYWPTPEQIEDCRARGEKQIDLLTSKPFDVIGDVNDLRVPDDLPARREPSSVTDTEVADTATDVIAQLLGDFRDVRGEVREAKTREKRATRAARDREGQVRALEERVAHLERVAQRPLWRHAASKVKRRLQGGRA